MIAVVAVTIFWAVAVPVAAAVTIVGLGAANAAWLEYRMTRRAGKR